MRQVVLPRSIVGLDDVAFDQKRLRHILRPIARPHRLGDRQIRQARRDPVLGGQLVGKGHEGGVAIEQLSPLDQFAQPPGPGEVGPDSQLPVGAKYEERAGDVEPRIGEREDHAVGERGGRRMRIVDVRRLSHTDSDLLSARPARDGFTVARLSVRL